MKITGKKFHREKLLISEGIKIKMSLYRTVSFDLLLVSSEKYLNLYIFL